mmetsp:Transcript_80760/g.254846  ORF Transcript_80760/g.254846 Transcript_80760/m.254846 type:complete len:254 (+) Transcript_80760:1049-1810(+)
MMMPSRGLPLPVVCLWSFFRPAMRSPRTVQQMQPLFISIMFSSVTLLLELSSLSSMPTSPNSFSMTAIFLPWFACRMWLSSVVFPAPRKPVMIVVGVFVPPPVAWSSVGPTILASTSLFLLRRASWPGCSSRDASRSTNARLWAPRPTRSSARSAYARESSPFRASSMPGSIFVRKASGVRRMSSFSTGGWSGKAAMSWPWNSSITLLTTCTPSKYFAAASRPLAGCICSSRVPDMAALAAPRSRPQTEPKMA